MTPEEIRQRLLSMQDLKYRDFHSGLLPNVDAIIGVRASQLRTLAKELERGGEAEAFLHDLPHKYYDENTLHAFLLNEIKDYGRLMEELERFLPYMDNWATCDGCRPKLFRKHLPELLERIRGWLESGQTYTVRFGMEMLMCHYLEAAFTPEIPALVAGVENEEYYVQMMQAWFFATALAKQWDAILPYLLDHRLSPWVHNKTIQKAVESYRITAEQKAYLKTLRV